MKKFLSVLTVILVSSFFFLKAEENSISCKGTVTFMEFTNGEQEIFSPIAPDNINIAYNHFFSWGNDTRCEGYIGAGIGLICTGLGLYGVAGIANNLIEFQNLFVRGFCQLDIGVTQAFLYPEAFFTYSGFEAGLILIGSGLKGFYGQLGIGNSIFIRHDVYMYFLPEIQLGIGYRF